MKILVTGATGFIGRHLVPALLAQGHAVTAVARDIDKAKRFDWFDQVTFCAGDMYKDFDNPFQQLGKPQAVVHLAWPGLPNYKDLFHFEDNLPADYRFLKQLVSAGIQQLLVTGTCMEYGLTNGALAEHLPPEPGNPYALAKDTLRRQLQSLQHVHAFNLQWARLFYMHGPGQSAHSVLSQLDRAIDAGASTFNMSGGEQLRDYLPVQEVAQLLAAVLANPECAGVVNVCSGQPISVRRLVEQHAAARGYVIGLNLGHYPYSDIEPMAFWGDTGKLSLILRGA